MKRRLAAIPMASLDQMKKEIVNVWNELSIETINALIYGSINARLRCIIEKKKEKLFFQMN